MTESTAGSWLDSGAPWPGTHRAPDRILAERDGLARESEVVRARLRALERDNVRLDRLLQECAARLLSEQAVSNDLRESLARHERRDAGRGQPPCVEAGAQQEAPQREESASDIARSAVAFVRRSLDHKGYLAHTLWDEWRALVVAVGDEPKEASTDAT